MRDSSFISRLTVRSASNLPKTESHSKIDPYVVLKIAGQEFKTRAIQNQESPEWNEVFFPLISKPYSGTIEISLYDENTFKDTLISTASVTLENFSDVQLRDLTVILIPHKDKYRPKNGNNAVLRLSLEGQTPTFTTLHKRVADLLNAPSSPNGRSPRVFENKKTSELFFPFPGCDGVFVGVKYNIKCSQLDVSLLSVLKDIPVQCPNSALPSIANPLTLDIQIPGPEGSSKPDRRSPLGRVANSIEALPTPPTKTQHRSFGEQGHEVAPGLVAYSEVRLDEALLGTDFSSIRLSAAKSQLMYECPVSTVAAAHGWKGSLSFTTASQVLDDVKVDTQSQALYMDVVPNELSLLIDYNKRGSDIQLAVLDSPQNASKAFELIVIGQKSKRTAVHYSPSESRLGGEIRISRVYKLNDMEYGTNLSMVRIRSFNLASSATMTLEEAINTLGLSSA